MTKKAGVADLNTIQEKTKTELLERKKVRSCKGSVIKSSPRGRGNCSRRDVTP